MSVPAFVQITPIVEAAAYSTAQTLTFGAATTAGTTVIVAGYVSNEAAASVAAITASVSMTGAVFIRRGDFSIRYPGADARGITLWQADNVAAGSTVITVTPSLANALNNSALFAIEVGTVHPSVVFEALVAADTDHGVFDNPIGPVPASGSISQADTLAVALSFINQSSNAANPGWQIPAGWSERGKTLLSSSGLRPIWVGTKTQTATDAVSVTVATTEADLYGRVGAVLLLRGTTGSPSPPPPSPTPSPPPPGPGPAPTPPPPGPAPAPAAAAFKFQNIDPTLAGTISDVVIQIHANPTTEQLLGTYIQSATGQAFVADAGKSAVVVTHNGTVPVTIGQTVKAVGQNVAGTAGFRGVISGTVIAAP